MYFHTSLQLHVLQVLVSDLSDVQLPLILLVSDLSGVQLPLIPCTIYEPSHAKIDLSDIFGQCETRHQSCCHIYAEQSGKKERKKKNTLKISS